MSKKGSRKDRKQQRARADRADEHGLPSRRPEPVPESRQRAISSAAGRVGHDASDDDSPDSSPEASGVAARGRGGSIVERWQRLPAPLKWGVPALLLAALAWLVLLPPNAPRVNAPAAVSPSAHP